MSRFTQLRHASLYGDGSVAYSLAEFDTFARHGVAVIAIVGNDAGWTQIAREQIEVLHDDVGVVLARTDYHQVAEGYGGRGLLLTRRDDVAGVLRQAVDLARQGFPVLVNAHLDKTEFRKGSTWERHSLTRPATRWSQDAFAGRGRSVWSSERSVACASPQRETRFG